MGNFYEKELERIKQKYEGSRSKTYGSLGLLALIGLTVATLYKNFSINEEINRTNRAPVSVCSKDINHDGRSDLVVKTKDGEYPFLQQEDGSYKSLDQLMDIQNKAISKLRESIESRLRENK